MTTRSYITALLLSVALSVSGCRERQPQDSESAHRVIYNLDSSQFFLGTFGPINGETMDRFVDDHARAGVTDLYINVNAQRTNFDSAVWEAAWEQKNPNAPVVDWVKNTGLLNEAGIDYPQRMLARSRSSGMRGWISIRMNDAHLPNEPEHPLHSDFWRAHPEWHLDNTGLDYEVADVRDHYIRLIQEVTERYDTDGIELDFLRFRYYFRDGRTSIGLPLMTALVERVHELAMTSSDRLGHKVQVAVRVPTSPFVSKSLGLDVIEWAKNGLVDIVIASPFWSSANTAIRLDEWKAALNGAGVELAVSSEDGVDSGGLGRRTMTPSEMRGLYASALFDGADAYFFNLFTNPLLTWPREEYYAVIRDVRSLDSLAVRERRHVVTIEDPWIQGEPRPRELLPAEGMHLEFKLRTGPRPGSDRQSFVELALSNNGERTTVTVNGLPTAYAGVKQADHLVAIQVPEDRRPPRSVYRITPGALLDGENVVVITGEEPVVVRWVEIRVEPARADKSE
jgi:hypothetical protein